VDHAGHCARAGTQSWLTRSGIGNALHAPPATAPRRHALITEIDHVIVEMAQTRCVVSSPTQVLIKCQLTWPYSMRSDMADRQLVRDRTND
jgi:hypothetical protein